MAKYQKLFLEEATDHLGEISQSLLELEKDTAHTESIDTIFRMAHSLKSMAASLGYDSVTELAHKLEDRMQVIRAEGRVSSPGELDVLFPGPEGLEQMVVVVRDSGEAPPVPEGLLVQLSQMPDPHEVEMAAAKKKVLN